jgi:hypothetical protein
MTTIKNASAARIDAIAALAQQLFGESDQLDEFKLRLNAEIFAKQGSATTKTTGGETKSKKSNTGAIKKSANPEDQCNAYIFAIVRNEETGEFEPKQCSLSHDHGSKFCKKHASVHGKRDDAASNYHGTDIVHEHTWQVLGSVENGPSYVFTKYHDQLLAKFNQASGSEGSGNESDEAAPHKKTSKTSVSKKSSIPKKEKKVRAEKKQKGPTAKRGKNPYFEFLSSERESIKADLLAENPELKGRDLTTSIAKEAGRRWNEMGEEDKQPYIDVVMANACLDGDLLQNDQSVETAVLQGSEEHLSPCCDDHAETEADQEEEEEENDRIYNEALNVWIDAETQLYFDSQDSETPLGQIVRGKTVAFKTKKQ